MINSLLTPTAANPYGICTPANNICINYKPNSIGEHYKFVPGMLMWMVTSDAYYECIITLGSDIHYYSVIPGIEYTSVLIGVDYQYSDDMKFFDDQDDAFGYIMNNKNHDFGNE